MSQKLSTPFFIAEVSGNHNGSLARAKQIIKAASVAGASAVKFQTYTPETMTLDLEKFSVDKEHKLWGGLRLFTLYGEVYTPWEWHKELFDFATSLGVVPFSTPFDITAVDFLESLNVSRYKIASLETGDVDLISYVASKGKPLIISTGASTLQEIEQAVKAAEPVLDELTLLVCTSSYPAHPSDAHVRRIETLQREFGVDVGLSDHTLGIGVSVAAISLGATIIEKHLTLRRSDGGHDSTFSLEPDEFKLLIEEGNKAHASLGNPEWAIQESEAESRRLRRSLYIAKSVKKGELATRENIRALRPNSGGPIGDIQRIIGKRFIRDYNPGDAAKIDCVE